MTNVIRHHRLRRVPRRMCCAHPPYRSSFIVQTVEIIDL